MGDGRPVGAELLSQATTELQDEGDDLDHLLSSLVQDEWSRTDPFSGRTVTQVLTRLTWVDELAVQAIMRPGAFRARPVSSTLQAPAELAPAPLMIRWRSGRRHLLAALRASSPGAAIPWFGQPLSPASLAAARLAGSWVAGVDVHGALHLPLRASCRLQSVAHLGVHARDRAFRMCGLRAPQSPFYIQLAAPDGCWSWGPPGADERVSGTALDFCLRVARRRDRRDTGLRAVGAHAGRWLDLARIPLGPVDAGLGAAAPRPSAAAERLTRSTRTAQVIELPDRRPGALATATRSSTRGADHSRG